MNEFIVSHAHGVCGLS